jgi:signal transduction histidine kinase
VRTGEDISGGLEYRIVRLGFSKRAVLRTGYGAVIAVLILSAAEAYRIQTSVSEQHLEIYRRYIEEDGYLAALRRNLWLSGSDVRDFFIITTPAQAQLLRSQLQALQKDDDVALAHLAANAGWEAIVPKLRKSLEQYWVLIDELPNRMLDQPDERKFAFLQTEVAPLRGELYSALIDLSEADQRKVQESERDFNAARSRAAERLMLMLAISVLLSFAVARTSVRHAESLERLAEQHFNEVEEARRELQQLSARLLEIEEEGRRRLSRELHDEIGQSLALLEIEISHAQNLLASDPRLVKDRLARARDLAQRTVQTVRNISVLLRPAMLDDLGLVPALQFQLEDFLRRSGIASEFVEQDVADRLPDAVKTCVYRVIQEALHNAEKHSAATRVRVKVQQLPDFLVAEVEDNGRGFEVKQGTVARHGGGLGLLGIRERVAAACGSVVIDSAPGSGTRISIRIPLPQEPVAASTKRFEVTA